MHRSSGRDDRGPQGNPWEASERDPTRGGADVANTDQREAWNGRSGDAWVRTQEEHDAMLEPWARVVAEAAAIRPGERVLDVGCGCGATTLAAAAACGPDGAAVGVDLSAPMLGRARELAAAAGVDNVQFVVGDAQVDDLRAGGPPYDVVVSRYGVMFFDDTVAAFANIGRATRPGGRLAMVVWAPMAEQDWLLVPAGAALPHLGNPDLGAVQAGAPGMFAFADPARIDEVLGAAGWTDVAADRQRRSMQVGGPGDVESALRFLLDTNAGRTLFAEAEPDAAEQAKKAIREALAAHLTPTAVELDGIAWSITARRPDQR
jgi:SAM-dependent methyltransferase